MHPLPATVLLRPVPKAACTVAADVRRRTSLRWAWLMKRRERELESGQVAAILHEEFVRRVEQERGR